MAASTEQKLDYLLKKIGYTASKTGLAEDSSLSGTKKSPFAESIPSPLVTASSSIWTDSNNIPTTPPGSDSSSVKVYLAGTSGHRMTADSTVSGSRAFIAYSTYNNTSTAILGDWIDTQFGDSYIIKVYKGDPNSGGTLLSAAGSGSNDTWFFDYASGVLNFNGTVVPSGVTDTNIYIVGYRYIGAKGTATAGINTTGTSFFEDIVVGGNAGIGSLNVTGVSTVQDLQVKGNNILLDHGGSMSGVTTIGSYYEDKLDIWAGIGRQLIPYNYDTQDLGDTSFRWRDGYIAKVKTEEVSGINMVTAGIGSTHVNLDVVVYTKNTDHRYYNQGSSDGYVITTKSHENAGGHGIQSPFFTFTPGRKYRFNQSDNSNNTYQIKFYLEADKTTLYETGVTYNGTAGSSGAYTQIEVTDQTPSVLFYQSVNNAYMGNAFQTNANVINTNYDAKLSGNLNVTGITTVGFATATDVWVSGAVTATTFESTIATGTAPFTVNSTTKVQYLNADYLDDRDTSATGGVNKVMVTDGSGNSSLGSGTFAATTFSGNLTGTVNTAAQPNITSLGTLTSLDVTGNVSIGGTLTYDDVTNVDSVGLITARSGVKVTSGGIDVTGVSTFGGAIDANSTLEVSGIANFDSTVKIGDKIEHLGDDNTNIRFPDADTFAVETAGNERLRITSAGALQLSDTNSPNDKNTDIWVADDALNFNAFGTNGAFIFKSGSSSTERLRIASDGKVGIGTDAPQYRLTSYETDGNTVAGHFRTNQSTSYIAFQASDTGGAAYNRIGSDGNDLVIWSYNNERLRINSNGVKIIKDGNLNISSTYIDFSGDVSTPLTAAAIYRPADNTLAFSTANEERLRITSAGKVGINTTNPGSKLEVWADDSDTDTDVFSVRGKTSAFNIRVDDADAANPTWTLRSYSTEPIAFAQGTDERLRITSAGIVGINSTSPSGAQVVIHNSDDSNLNAISIYNDNGNMSSSLSQDSTGAGSYLQKDNAGNIKTFIRSYNTSYFLGGNIGIGTNDPQQLLDLRANATDTRIQIGTLSTSDAVGQMPNSSEYGLSLVHGNAELGLHKDASGNYSYVMGTYSAADIPLVFRTASRSERMRITNGGNVAIGTDDPGLATYGDDLTIARTTHAGITLRTGTGHKGTIYFSDGTSGGNEYEGSVQYDHSDRTLRFASGGTRRVDIDHTGDVKFWGTTNANSANKNVNLTAPSWNTGEEDVNLVQVENEETSNQISFGGGTSGLNAATQLIFRTASAVNNVTGTERLRITSEGYVQVKTYGSATTGGAPLYVGVTAKDSINYGGGQDDTACVRIEDVGSSNGYYHGLELRTKRSGDVRIYAHDVGDNIADLVFATDNGGLQESLRILSDGKVGIGITNPATKFVVSNDGAEGLEVSHASGVVEVNAYKRSDSSRSPFEITAQTFKLSTGNPSLNVGLYQDSTGKVGINETNPAAYGAFVAKGTGNIVSLNASSGAASLSFFENGTGRFYIKTLNGSDGLAFVDADNSTERLRITGIGSVGINNTSPTTILDIKSAKNGDGLTITKGSNTSVFLGHNGSGDEGLLFLKDGGSNTIQIYAENGQPSYFNAGNIGIGTDNPGSLLTLDHATNPAIQFKDSGTKVASINAEGTQTNIASFESKDLVFATSTSSAFTERLRITSDGKIGINTTGANNGPSAPVHIYGNSDTTPILAFTRSTIHDDWQGAGIGLDDEGGTYKGALTFYTHSSSGTKNDSVTEKLRIASNGDIYTPAGGRLFLGGGGSPTNLAGTQYSKLLVDLANNPDYIHFRKNLGQDQPILNITHNQDYMAAIRYANSGDAWASGVQSDGSYFFSHGMGASGGGGTEAIRITSAGNVGIGTNNPTSLLTVGARPKTTSTAATVLISPASGNASIQLRGGSPTLEFDSTGGGNGQIFTDSADLTINDGTLDGSGNEILRITSARDVLIGTNTNAGGNRLYVVDNFTDAYVNPSDSILRIENSNTSGTTGQASISFTSKTSGSNADSAIVSQAEDASGNARLEFWTDTANVMTEKMVITSSGSVLIGTAITAHAGIITATKFVTSTGTSGQFVKGDGSLDSSNYILEGDADLDLVLGNGNSTTKGMQVGLTTFSDNITVNGTTSTFNGDIYSRSLTLTDNGTSADPLLLIKTDDTGPWGFQVRNDTYGTGSQGFKIYQSNSGVNYVQTRGTSARGRLIMQQHNGTTTNDMIEFTEAGEVELQHQGNVRLRTTGIGVSVIGVGNTAYIEGPDEIWLDPHPYGVGQTSGIVRVRGDLYVDGKEFIVDVDKIELGDFQIGIATTAGTNLLLDGAGIGIGSESIRKTLTWDNSSEALKSSEHFDLASGKRYKINGNGVISANALGSGIVNSSLTSVGTLGSLNVSGLSTFSSAVNITADSTVAATLNSRRLNVASNHDLVFNNGTWSGNIAGKIQHHNNILYFQGGTGGWAFLASGGAGRLTIDGDGHMYPGADSTYDLGATDKKWKTFYVDQIADINNSVGSASSVLSSTGSGLEWVAQSGGGGGGGAAGLWEQTDVGINTSSKVGIGTTSPNYKLEVSGTNNNSYLSLENTTAADTDGSRYSRILFRGFQSGGELSSLAAINGAHDGTADDQKGRISFRTNDGSDGESPTERLRINSTGGVVIRHNGATASDGYAGLEVRAAKDKYQLVLASSSAVAGDNRATLGFKVHNSGQEERVKAAIIVEGNGDAYGEVDYMSFCLDAAADNGNADTTADEKLRITSTGWQQGHASYAGVGINTFASWARTGGAIRAEVGYNAVTTDYMYFGTGTNHPLALRTNNTTALYIDANQKVGIGTVTPGALLDVQHHIGSAAQGIIRNKATQANASSFIQAADSGSTYIGLLKYGTGHAAYGALGAGDGALYANSGDGNDTNITIMADSSTGYINFATGGNTERLKIDSGGRVLLGTQRTYGNYSYYDDITINNSNGATNQLGGTGITLISKNTSWNALLFGDSDDNGIGAIKYDHSNNHMRFVVNGNDPTLYINSSGNVGIGTDNPGNFNAAADNLVVGTGVGHNGITINSAADGDGWLVFNDAANTTLSGAIQYNHVSDYMAFRTGGATNEDRLRIHSGGNIGIGTDTDSTQRLAVYGTNAAIMLQNPNTGTGANNGFYMGNGNGTIAYLWNYENEAIRFATNDTEKFRIDKDGRAIISNNAGSHAGGSQFVVMGGAINNYASAAFGNYTAAPGDGDTFAMFRFNSGSSGTSRGAEIIAAADADWTAGSSYPTRLVFSTTALSATSSTERLRITSAGNINQTIGADTIGFNQTASGNHYIKNVVNANRSAAGASILALHAQWNSKDVSAIKFRTGADTTNKDDGHICFETSSANNIGEKMRITSAGNVGINSTVPGAPLDVRAVNGTIARFGDINVYSYEGLFIKNNITGYPAIENGDSTKTVTLRAAGSIQMEIDSNNNDTNKYFRVTTNATGASGTELFRVQEDGKVGIGTDNPLAKLALHGSGGGTFDAIHITNSDTGVAGTDGTILGLNSSEDFTIWNAESTNVVIAAGNDERLRIKSTGGLKFSNMGAGSMFEIGGSTVKENAAINIHRLGNGYGNIRLSSNYGVYTYYAGASDNTDELWVGQDNQKHAYVYNEANKALYFGTNNATRMTLTNGGRLGLGTTNPGSTLYVTGASTVDSATFRTADSNGTSSINILSEGTTGYSRIKFSDTAGQDGSIRYDHGNRRIAFAAGGTTDQLYLDSTGNVGIGITNPGYKTVIKVSTTTAYDSTSTGSSQHQLKVNNAGASGVAGILLTAEPSSGSAGHASIRTIAPSSGSADLIFSTRNSSTFGEKLRITSEGNLDIPFANNGTGLRQKIRFVTEADYFDEVAYISADRTAVSNAPTDLVFGTGAIDGGSVNTQERLRITSDGNLYLGGNASVNDLTESGGGQRGLVIGTTGMGNAGLAIINSTTGTGRIYFGDNTGSSADRNRGQINYYHNDGSNSDYMMFATAGSEALRITADGQLGVNNTSPDAWHTQYTSLQIHDAAVLYGSQDDSFVGLGANHFLNTSGDFKYSNTDFASRFYQVNSDFVFESAASGTAGDTLSFTSRFEIKADGDVEFKNTSGVTSCTWDASAQSLIFKDDSKAVFGDGSDLSIYWTGSRAKINAANSNLDLESDYIALKNQANSKEYLNCTNGGAVKIYHDNQERFSTTGIGVSIAGTGIGNTAYIEGPSEIWIDPHPSGGGEDSGIVRIKGDLYVDGTEFIVDVDKIELGDFQIGIASTAGSNAVLDGAGIGIGSTNIRKTITWNNATSALMSSENWNLASGKHYEIAGTDVLTSTTLGSGVVNSSLTSVGTLSAVTVSGTAEFDGGVNFDNADDAGKDLQWQPTNDRLAFFDDVKATFGNSANFEIYQSGNHSYMIHSNASGNYFIRSSKNLALQSGGSTTGIDLNADGWVALNYSGSEKLKTNNHGVVITGIATATDFDSTSDIRLKTNIKPIEDPLAKVIQIEGVSFNWKENNRPALGVIADQVQEIIPELVHGDDPKTVNYNGLIGLLIEAVKEQQTQIDSLKNRLSKLE